MDAEDVKTAGAIIGPIIATCSLALNAYQFRQNSKLKNTVPIVERKEELRTSLKAVVGRISSSFIFRVQPHNENWERGFPSLERFREVIEAANTLFMHSSIPESDISEIVNGLFMRTMSVMAFRDSYDIAKGRHNVYKGNPNVPVSYEHWPEGRLAEEALKELQTYARTNEKPLKDYLRKLNRAGFVGGPNS